MQNPYDLESDPQFQKFFGKLLTKGEIMKSDKEGFNKYCANVMGLIVVPSEYSDEHIFVKNANSCLEWCYNPYDDLNQMADVVDELSVNPKYEPDFKQLVNNMVLDIPLTVKSVMRDFIISTTDKDNEK